MCVSVVKIPKRAVLCSHANAFTGVNEIQRFSHARTHTCTYSKYKAMALSENVYDNAAVAYAVDDDDDD